MKTMQLAAITRCAVAVTSLSLAVWGLSGCGESESGHDEAETSHSDTGEAGDHSHDDAPAATEAHNDDGHAHGDEASAPTTFSGAMHEIEEAMDAIVTALASDRLDDIHGHSEVITNLAQLVGQLALADDSGVARESVRDVNVAGRALASASDTLHEVSDGGDMPKSREEFQRMKTLVETLSQFAGPADDHDH